MLSTPSSFVLSKFNVHANQVSTRYRRDPNTASRLTLIETRPAEPGFRELGFKICSMSNVFRADDLPASRQTLQSPPAPTMRTPLSTHTNSATYVPRSGSPAPSSDSNNGSSWITIAKGNGANATKSIDIAPRKHRLDDPSV